MRILHIITNTELGGAQSVCIFLANAAAQEQNTVAVASMSGGYLWEQLHQNVIRFSMQSMVKPISLCADIRCYFELKKIIMCFAPDIIHLHSSKAGALGRIAGKRYRDRIIYTVHGFDSIRLRHKVFLPFERFLQRYCTATVAVSYYDELHLKKERIHTNVMVIHNGIMLAKKQRIKLFDRAGYKKVIMTIARISPQKKFKGFLTVAAQQAMQDFLFVWIGGSADKSLDELKQQYSIPSNVLLLGDYPDASSLLEYCDLFILLTNYEGLPMTILEAMAQRKAIVASDVGGISELVDNSNGILVKTEEETIAAIQQILGDDEKLKQMEEASFERFSKFFTLDIMWGKYRKLYKEIAKD